MKKLLAGLATWLFLFNMAGMAKANTYKVDISSPTVDITYVADFTSQGFDPSVEQVISGSLFLMVKASSTSSNTSFTITLENNERDTEWVTNWEALRITLQDFTLIDEDGTIEYTVTDYSGWGYTGAGEFTIETSAIVPDTVELPSTGQKTSYATGDDGDLEAGVSWPATRFTDNGDGTVTDGLTGLVWLQDASCLGVMIWSTALSDANALADGTCGLADGSTAGDWRLPNVNELESLVNAGEADSSTWLNGQGFTNVLPSKYWSSTTNIVDTDTAWFVQMNTGFVWADNSTSTANRVWAVSGESTAPAQLWKTGQTTSYAAGDDGNLQKGAVWLSTRFTDNGDGTVSDGLTGLVWLQNANCFGNSNWPDSLSDANTLADGACGLTDSSAAGDWRLPNRKELRSLIDYSQLSPGLPSGHSFSNLEYARYWTSTTAAASTGSAWHVTLNGIGYGHDGLLSYHAKSQVNTYRSLPVREGTAAVPVPDITVTDSVAPNNDLNIPFGNVTENTTSDQTVTVTNGGNADLDIGQINSISAPFSILNDNCSGQTIIPAANCTFDVRFSPAAAVVFNDSLVIPSNDTDETVNVSGTGTAVPVPDITVTDSVAPNNDLNIPFGNVTENTTSDQTVTVTNGGNADLDIGQINSISAPFSILNDTCSNQPLTPISNCTFDVQFAPTAAVTSNDSFDIPSDDPDENPVTVNVSGTGLQSITNNPPDKSQLVYPADGQQNLSTEVTFQWQPVTDPDGDPVNYDLYFCDNADPLNCAPVQVASLGSQGTDGQSIGKNYYAGITYGTGIMFFGVVLAGGISSRKKMGLLIAMAIVTGMLLTSCGSSSSSGTENKDTGITNKTYTAVVNPGTPYFWTVVAKDDQGGEKQSAVWSFTTK